MSIGLWNWEIWLLLYTVRPSCFQPRPKFPWNFLLLGFSCIKRSSESVKKNICHQSSKRVILKKQVFFTKTCSLVPFSSHVCSSEFWKLDDRCFSWLILNCLIYTYESLKRKIVHGTFNLGKKTRSAQWADKSKTNFRKIKWQFFTISTPLFIVIFFRSLADFTGLCAGIIFLCIFEGTFSGWFFTLPVHIWKKVTEY